MSNLPDQDYGDIIESAVWLLLVSIGAILGAGLVGTIGVLIGAAAGMAVFGLGKKLRLV